MYLEVFMVLFFFFLIVFIIGQWKKDNSIVDIAWGSGFLITAWYTFIRNPYSGLKGLIITICITIWGARLTLHIAKRNIGKQEDYRYVDMRKRWGDRFLLIKSFLHVYLVQMIIQYIVTLPVIYGNTTKQQPYWFNFLGLLLWGVGFLF